MDAGGFYALLRFEEASLALRAVLRMGLVDRLAGRSLSREELRQEIGFTPQAARTFFALLQVMRVLETHNGEYRVTSLAAECLAECIPTSRKPYLAMGTGPDADALIALLQGQHAAESVPLYGGEQDGATLMDIPEAAREIALGLSSRARNFAQPLAAAIAGAAPSAKSIADIGAGSPYVAQACLNALPHLEKVILVDRANGMQFAREIAQTEQYDVSRLDFQEGDFFTSVPPADVYVLSNTAHDWLPEEYAAIAQHIRGVIPAGGLVCIHEPVLMTAWKSDAEWIQALWMACYALTLLRLTLGKGTCYSLEEHHQIMSQNGFAPTGDPTATCDGCTALFYRVD